jgi:polyisoprenoid-binding protein YceI
LIRSNILNTFTPFVLAAVSYAAGLPTENATISVDAGSASFLVGTNIPAVTVKGKSTAVHGAVQVRQTDEGLQLQHIEASVAVATLNTGMGVRDQHMRKYIFTTADGSTPDLKFVAPEGSCTGTKDTICRITGELSIRGVARPFGIELKVRENGSVIRASGVGTVKLSDYGIEPPSQFGVKTSNEVQLQLDFTGKPQEPAYRAAR